MAHTESWRKYLYQVIFCHHEVLARSLQAFAAHIAALCCVRVLFNVRRYAQLELELESKHNCRAPLCDSYCFNIIACLLTESTQECAAHALKYLQGMFDIRAANTKRRQDYLFMYMGADTTSSPALVVNQKRQKQRRDARKKGMLTLLTCQGCLDVYCAVTQAFACIARCSCWQQRLRRNFVV
jgi:hypothetical protein